MAGGTRSHSPPLPPNATYNHPTISLNILPSAKLFTAGSKVTGMLEIICKERNSVALGQLAIEFFGIEELKLLDHSAQSSIHGPHKCIFQGPALPPSNAVATSEAPIGGHYYTALRGRTKFPFSFPLPSKLPSSTNFNDKARVSYALKATCQVLSIESRQNVLVTKSKNIQIVEKLLDWNDTKYHEPVEMRGELRDATGTGAGVWAEVKIDKMLHFNQNSSKADDGLIRAQLTVKNNSRRTLSGGVNVKICRKLVLPQDPTSLTDASRIEVVRNCPFRGVDYEFPSAAGQAKMVKLVCQLPSAKQDDIDHVDHNSSCLSVRGIKLFSVDMFLRVELELGALSNDLIVDLPIYVTHAFSLPKELLLRSTPQTIEHVPSSNHNSITHLSRPESSTGRASRNTSRSSSPHPPSLQPGNISRSTSPRLALSAGGDWGGMNRSAPPSPSGSAHFSPLPTPQPSPRFPSPMPFFPSSAVPNHQPSIASAAPAVNYLPQPTPWSSANHSAFNSLSSSHGFSSYPQQSVTPAPTLDPRSQVGPISSPYPPPQPIFSPPTTPWRRQTLPTSTYFDHPPSMPHPDHSFQPIHGMPPPALEDHHVQANYPQEPASHSAYEGYDVGSPMPSNWRTRHQSPPAAPAPPSAHYRNSDTHYNVESVPDHTSSLMRTSSNSRRTSEPINNSSGNSFAHQQPNSAGIIVRKRALPMPPQVSQALETASHGLTISENSYGNMSDQQAQVANEHPNVVQHSRLATIGEIGESRPGTLSAKLLSQNELDLLARSGDSSDEEDVASQHPRRRQPVRVVSHPRGMRPRRSDGSDSVQALEDIVALEEERRSADGARLRDPSPDQTPTLNNQELVFQDSSDSDQHHDDKSTALHVSSGHATRDRSSSSPHLHNSTRATHPTGLANLVQFLNRATSTEPPRASSAQEATLNPANLSVDHDYDHDSVSVQSTEDKMARDTTPSYTGSALRMKSSRISYGETLIDAVPSPTSATKTTMETKSSTPTRQDTTEWKPPPAFVNPTSLLPRTSISEQMNFCDDQPTDEPPVGRESIAPDALFPQFEPGQLTTLTAQIAPHPSGISAKAVTPTAIPENCSSPSTQPVEQPPTEPLIIPTHSPTVKRKGFKAQRKSSQPKKFTSDSDSYSSPSRTATKPVSTSPNPSIAQEALVQPPQTTIVERLRSQHVPMAAHEPPTSQSRQGPKDERPARQESIEATTQRAPRRSDAVNIGLGLDAKQMDLMLEGSQRHMSDDRPLQPRPTLPKPPAQSTLVTKSSQPTPLPAPSLRNQECVIPPLSHRLSAIPKSTIPLSLGGSSLYQSSPNSTPHRPLPISPSCAHEAKMTTLNPMTDVESIGSVSAKVAYDANMGTRAFFSSQKSQASPAVKAPEKRLSQLNSPSQLTPDSLGTPCSPTSPTNLARKSRIKRQMSSTYTNNDSVCLPKVGSRIGGGDGMLSISRVPGGWNEDESDEIEAQLIAALRETNLAVQKATSRTLATPEFIKSPSKHRNSIRSSMYSTSHAGGPSADRGSRIALDRSRTSMSIAERTNDDLGTMSSVDQSREPDSHGTFEWPSASRRDDSVKSFDEDTPIPLTSGEYKSMRGGRGGRVSSVVGQWAKLTSTESVGLQSPRKYSEVIENKVEETAPMNISTRGLSIRPKNVTHSSQYSITGLLSRNSSLTSQLSCSRTHEPRAFAIQDTNRRFQISPEMPEAASKKLPMEDSKLPTAPAYKPSSAFPARRVLPVVPPPVTEENKTRVAPKLGYRNLANRLSGGMNPPSSQSASKSASSSTSSISSLGSLNNNLPSSLSSADESLPLKKSHRQSRLTPLLPLADRRKLNAIHTLPSPSTPGAISDLVKRWES
ncbi:hypothetical protein Pst134EB_025063 [Puccinia striiformis f. sp. tritici]|nr:hypothetical protein Pst134EB_025063 [Puccinia striiformis f. sp. tritici]